MLVREDLVDHGEDNPAWEVFPNTPPFDYSSTDTRVRWCFLPGPGCDEVVGTPASPLAWDVKPANRTPTDTTTGNNSFAVHNWFSNDPFKVGTRAGDAAGRTATTPTPGPTSGSRRSARRRPSTPPQRNDIDAARANLFAMHNRMHDWSYHLGFTEATFNMQDDNFGRGGKANDPEQGNAQAGGVTGGPPDFAARDNANQITPPDGHRADHQHVPVAADRGLVLRTVRGRRLRHVGDRARVHPRHHQPDDRRPERRPQLAAGHERELVRPAGDGVPRRARLRAAGQPGVHDRRSTSPATRSRASATTT